MPVFYLEVGQQIVEALGLSSFYDGTSDEFVFPSEDEEFGAERFAALEADGIGKLYAIGTGSWIWEQLEVAFTAQ